jgi:hypothetical protein
MITALFSSNNGVFEAEIDLFRLIYQDFAKIGLGVKNKNIKIGGGGESALAIP